jgi:hypothetical protein
MNERSCAEKWCTNHKSIIWCITSVVYDLSDPVTSVRAWVCEKSDVSKVCGIQRKGNRHNSSDVCW